MAISVPSNPRYAHTHTQCYYHVPFMESFFHLTYPSHSLSHFLPSPSPSGCWIIRCQPFGAVDVLACIARVWLNPPFPLLCGSACGHGHGDDSHIPLPSVSTQRQVYLHLSSVSGDFSLREKKRRRMNRACMPVWADDWMVSAESLCSRGSIRSHASKRCWQQGWR